jgi:GDPmannose 4,6-dehydratase
MQWLMLQQDQPEDYVIATGTQYTVREFVNAAAEEMGMKINWRGRGLDEEGVDEAGRRIIAVDPRYFRPAEVSSLLGDASKARAKLGWKPRTTFREMVAEMVASDLKNAERDQIIQKSGHRVYDRHE